jgi:hypothetical protein
MISLIILLSIIYKNHIDKATYDQELTHSVLLMVFLELFMEAYYGLPFIIDALK